MSLEADAGKASVTRVCDVFGLSREDYDAAVRSPGQLELPLWPVRRAGVSTEELEAGIREVVMANPA